MKFCQSHWNRLRSAIEQHGMHNLVAKNGAEAVERMTNEISGNNELKDFDPLMAAHNEILRRFLEPLKGQGLYMFTGDYCPLCELVRLNPRPAGKEIDANWIAGVTRDLQQFCVERGLIAAN